MAERICQQNVRFLPELGIGNEFIDYLGRCLLGQVRTSATVLLQWHRKSPNPPFLPFQRYLSTIDSPNPRDLGMDRPFPAYRGGEPYIFVSYAHEDSNAVFPEIQWLKDQGFNIWYDEGISPGHEWRTELGQSIERCGLFLYFVSPPSVASEHCQREVNYAMDQKRPLLVVHLEETTLPTGLGMSLSSIQAIMRHELSELDYRIKLLKGTSDHLERGVAQIATTTNTDRKLIYAILALGLLVAGFVTDRFLFTDQQAVTQAPATAASSQNSPVIRFDVPLSEDADLYLGEVFGTPFGRPAFTNLALSNDGNLLVYTAWEEGPDGLSSRLYIRRLDRERAEPIAGTEGAGLPFFSPDDVWIGFGWGGSSSIELRRVLLTDSCSAKPRHQCLLILRVAAVPSVDVSGSCVVSSDLSIDKSRQIPGHPRFQRLNSGHLLNRQPGPSVDHHDHHSSQDMYSFLSIGRICAESMAQRIV
jgi:hypothetical protein|tara:strand:- start:387 stop:1808 length:1422 start_codon:yes stop_codon:yes gene_type:complete